MRRLTSRILITAAIAGVAMTAGAVLWQLRGERQTFYTDADAIKELESEAQARVRDVLWRPAQRLPEAVNTAADEYEPRLTADGLSLLFVRGRAGGGADIYIADRTAQGWSEPRPLEGINTDADELGPEPSADGRTLFFHSDRAGGHGGYDLWMTVREGDGWAPAVNLGPQVNGPYNDYGAATTPDGAWLYFASNRPRPDDDKAREIQSPLAVREDMAQRDYDLYLAPVGIDGVEQARPLLALNTGANEVAPAVSPGGDFLYFCTDRTGGIGGFDVVRSRRLRGEHLPAANLGPSLNTDANELDPSVALGGFGLYFASDRPGAGRPDLDLYFAASREVFVETEVQRAAIDWWAIWSAIWPLLLWLLLIALLWLALSRISDHGRLGRLSLLARCLLLSLLVHALLMLLLTAVNVTTSLSELLRDRSGTRVALVSPSASAAGDLAAQLRGSLTDVEIEVSQNASSQRQEQMVEPQPSSAMATLTVQRSAIEARPEPPRPAAADDAPAPATTPTVQAASPDQDPQPVPVTVPAQPQPVRTAEAPTPSSVPATHSAPSRREVETARPNEAAASNSVEIAVQPTNMSTDERLEQRLHDAGQMPDAETAPETAMAEAAPAQPVESAVATIDLTLPSSSDTPTERSTEAQVTVAAQSAPAVRQRSSSAPRAVTSPSVNVSPQPLDRPLAQGSLAVADARPAAASAHEATTDHRRGLTSLLVRPSAAPSLTSLPEATTAAAGEAVADPAAVAVASAARQSASASSPGSSAAVALETARPVAPSAVAGSSMSSASASDSPAPSTPAASPSSPAARRAGGAPAASLALNLPTSSDGRPSTAAADAAPASTGRAASRSSRAALTSATSSDASGNPRVDLGPVDRSASPSETKSLAADLPTTGDAVPSHSASAGPRRPTVPVDALSGAIDLALPSGAPQVDRTTSERPTGATSATAMARRADVTSPDLPSTSGMRRIDLSPRTAAPPAADRLVAAARVVSADGAARRGGAGFQSGGIEVSLSSTLVTELPELEESVASGPGERGRTMPPASVSHDRTSLARADLQIGGTDAPAPEQAEMLPPVLDAPVQRLLASAAQRDDLEIAEVLARPESPSPPKVRPLLASLDLSLPRQVQPTESPFEHRTPERREELLQRGGGSAETEHAVTLALQWLARHQSEDGHWDSRHYDRGCGECDGPARVDCDIALTGLSLLCFLAADHSPSVPGPYQSVVAKGVEYLLRRMGSTGDLLGDESMYSHGIATIALAEAYGVSGDERLAQPLRMAVAFIYDARNRRLGGWRYDPGQVGDTSVLGWQVMAVKSAERAGLAVPKGVYEVADHWLQRVKDPWSPGLYAYQPKRRVTHPMTAEAMFVRQLLGVSATDPTMQAGADYIMTLTPDWKRGPNTYYWYYATLAMYHHGGEHWERWNEIIKRELLPHQHQSGQLAGSWDPEGKWANVGGRIYQTALCTLTLEVYYRYLPLYMVEREGVGDGD